MSKREILEQRAGKMGIAIYTYSPGDGVTRYRFGNMESSYFASDGLATLLGLKDATVWLNGYAKAYEKLLPFILDS